MHLLTRTNGCLQGRAVMLVLAARHDMGTRRLEETNRLIVYVLDNAAAMSSGLRANPLGKFLCLFDLSGVAGMHRHTQVYVCCGLPTLHGPTSALPVHSFFRGLCSSASVWNSLNQQRVQGYA
jgi:hypothetical protein